MSWTNRTLAMMADTVIRPLFILRTIAVNNAPGVAGYTAATDPTIGDPIIGARGVRVQGSTFQPGTWQSTLGGFSVDLAGDLSTFKSCVTRGTFLELLIGFPGYTAAEYEVIAVGQAQQLSGSSPRSATLECRDVLSALRCRPTSTAGTGALGYRVTGAETTLAAGYTAGAATLDLTAVTGFALGTSTTELAAMVTPTTGDPFILTYTGVSGTDLTGVAATAVHGTTAVDAVAGDAVQPLIWIEAHPSSAVRAFLLSVLGSGVHTYDVLPQGDGLSLPYDWVDHTDCALWKGLAEPTMVWEFASMEAIDSPGDWLAGILAAGGFFLTVRMGLLTIRAAQLLSGQTMPIVVDITDDDVEIGGWSWEAWAADTASEACKVTVYSATGNTSTSTENPATLPFHEEDRYDLSELLFTDQSANRTSISGRVAEAARRVPERYTMRCAGLRLAQLAPGDRVRLYSRLIAGRLGASMDGLDGVSALVVQCSPDYGGGRVTLSVLIYPPTAGAFP